MNSKILTSSAYLIAAILLILTVAVIFMQKANKQETIQNLQNNQTNTPKPSTNSSVPAPTSAPSMSSNSINNANNQNASATISALVTCTEKIDKIPCKGWLVVTAKTGQEVTRGQSNGNGELTLKVPAGDYVLKGIPNSSYPVIIVQPESISLKENGSIKVSVNYWTGLR